MPQHDWNTRKKELQEAMPTAVENLRYLSTCPHFSEDQRAALREAAAEVDAAHQKAGQALGMGEIPDPYDGPGPTNSDEQSPTVSERMQHVHGMLTKRFDAGMGTGKEAIRELDSDPMSLCCGGCGQRVRAGEAHTSCTGKGGIEGISET